MSASVRPSVRRIGEILATLALAGVAMAEEMPNRVRFGMYFPTPTGSTDARFRTVPVEDPAAAGSFLQLGFDTRFEAEPATGLYLGFEHRLGELIGIDVQFMSARQEIEVSGRAALDRFDDPDLTPPPSSSERTRWREAAVGDIWMTPITVGVNFHLTEASHADFYVGVSVAYVVTSGSITIDPPQPDGADLGPLRVAFENAWGGDVHVGLDVPFVVGWGLTFQARYLRYAIEAEGCGTRLTIDVDPAILTLGIFHRW